MYATAVVLHPTYKWHYFETQWTDNEDKLSTLRNAKNAVRKLWESKYKTLNEFGNITVLDETQCQIQHCKPDTLVKFVLPPEFLIISK